MKIPTIPISEESARKARRRSGWLACFACLVSFAFSDSRLAVALAQSATTSLSGFVIDQEEAIVIGADLVLLNPSTGFQRELKTNGEGLFAFQFLPPGTYQVTITQPGFAAVVIENLVLNVNDPRSIRIRLRVGRITETVVVEAEAGFRDSPVVSTIIDRRFIANLPLNGQNFLPLITLAPGVVPIASNAAASGWLYSVNGQRPSANYLTIDGVSANIAAGRGLGLDPAVGGALPGLTVFGSVNNLVSIDALQEFKILTSAQLPEFGRTSGGQISIVTRSGTNEFHGTLFDYFRNETLDANDWFANRNGLAKAPLRQNDFGGVLGGPILPPRRSSGAPDSTGSRRLFFFFSYEGMRVRQPQVASIEVPSVNLRRVAPAPLKPFLDAFPLPNGPEDPNTGFAPLIINYSNPSTLRATSLRIDQTIKDRLLIFGRYNDAPSENITRSTSSLSVLGRTRLNTRTLTLGGTLSIGPRIAHDFRFNVSRTEYDDSSSLDSFAGAVPPPDSRLFPEFASRDDSRISFALNFSGPFASFEAGRNVTQLQRQLNLVDTLSVTPGAHQLKFGVDYRRLRPGYQPAAYEQSSVFYNATALAQGLASAVYLTASEGAEPLFTNFSAFGQDTWRASRRLTLTYGLRWELNPPPSAAKGILPYTAIGLDDPATMRLAPKNSPLWKTTYHDFAPRLGAAYQLSQARNLETVFRGGIGLFYDLGPGYALGGYTGAPFSRTSYSSDVPFPLTPARARPPAAFEPSPPYGSVKVIDQNLQLPYTLQWNLAVEQSLGAKQTISATYVAALGRRLINGQNIRNPSPLFAGIQTIKNDASSDYHALQLQFQRRLSRGWQAFAGYAWSHSIDLVSDEVKWGIDRGNSDFDVRQVFSGAVTYDLPAPASNRVARRLLHGWSIDSTVRAQSALPVNVITVNASVSSETPINKASEILRPNLVLGVPLYLRDPSAPGGKRINPAAFSSPFLGLPNNSTRQGTLGRNALRGFPFHQLDLSMRRQFKLTGKVGLQFKADLFNLFNRPNFSNPDGMLYNGLATGQPPSLSPSFGLSDSMVGRSGESTGVIGGLNSLYQAGGPRSIQLSLKLQF
ncbi:MAG TPA: carboxypeptidase regulatory-like domain-containing protein [Blastocatellia bacterium]|nr:carboxypeptidase regulatory-like domain-containing protein [Blastocatellia bacterium]